MNTDQISQSLERCFMSPNVADSNLEDANVVDVIDRAARNLSRIANAITPNAPSPMKTDCGVYVGSLTEAVAAAANSLHGIAEAISDLAEAVRER
jgi:phage terminase large subunit-like protein